MLRREWHWLIIENWYTCGWDVPYRLYFIILNPACLMFSTSIIYLMINNIWRSPSSIIWIVWFLRKLLDVILNLMDYNTLWIKHQCSRSKWGYCENKNSKTLTLCKLCSLHVKISKFDILILWFETYSSYERYVISMELFVIDSIM